MTFRDLHGNAFIHLHAARAFPSFDDRGTLNIGAPADVAIMELKDGAFEFEDS